MSCTRQMSPCAGSRSSRSLAAVMLAAGIACAAALAGCAGVEPWERDLHARADMKADAHDAAIDDHIYFSKEASSGGRSFAGGGCGCN
ncbi:MAG TPA: DUF4266 domain-containing protein [Steroidobacteraceae bacterium]|nr:DUF4266 domain-containing protein [Steroidobacteraceae bacterium]